MQKVCKTVSYLILCKTDMIWKYHNQWYVHSRWGVLTRSHSFQHLHVYLFKIYLDRIKMSSNTLPNKMDPSNAGREFGAKWRFNSKFNNLIIIFNNYMKREFRDTKRVSRIRKSKKNRQHNGKKKKDKQRSTKHTHNTKDQVTQTPLKTGS